MVEGDQPAIHRFDAPGPAKNSARTLPNPGKCSKNQWIREQCPGISKKFAEILK
jgi:hypothetical protein